MPKYKLTILLFFFSLFLPVSYARAFTILSNHNFAWSNNVGWINFAPVNAGVTVTDSALSGSAWSANKGYINFAPAQGGVSNDGTGNLSGFAWGEELGYIDFNNVNINGSTGKFSGTATGALVGTITFDCVFCDVETDWRSSSVPTPPVPQGIGGSSGGRRLNLIPALPTLGLTNLEQLGNIDIIKDGVIDIFDFNTMMVNWGKLIPPGSAFNSGDMNGDGIVDINDFNILMIDWGKTYQL